MIVAIKGALSIIVVNEGECEDLVIIIASMYSNACYVAGAIFSAMGMKRGFVKSAEERASVSTRGG